MNSLLGADWKTVAIVILAAGAVLVVALAMRQPLRAAWKGFRIRLGNDPPSVDVLGGAKVKDVEIGKVGGIAVSGPMPPVASVSVASKAEISGGKIGEIVGVVVTGDATKPTRRS